MRIRVTKPKGEPSKSVAKETPRLAKEVQDDLKKVDASVEDVDKVIEANVTDQGSYKYFEEDEETGVASDSQDEDEETL